MCNPSKIKTKNKNLFLKLNQNIRFCLFLFGLRQLSFLFHSKYLPSKLSFPKFTSKSLNINDIKVSWRLIYSAILLWKSPIMICDLKQIRVKCYRPDQIVKVNLSYKLCCQISRILNITIFLHCQIKFYRINHLHRFYRNFVSRY